MVIGTSTFMAKKSMSPNELLRRAPRQRSIASRILDFPLSPGPMRQLMPGDGAQSSACIDRKLLIFSRRMRATEPPQGLTRTASNHRRREFIASPP